MMLIVKTYLTHDLRNVFGNLLLDFKHGSLCQKQIKKVYQSDRHHQYLVLPKLIACSSVAFEELSQLTLVFRNTLLSEAQLFLQFWCPCLRDDKIFFSI